MRARSTRLLLLVYCGVYYSAWSQLRAEALRPPRLDPAGISGTLVICGGGKVPEAARSRFVELAGGEKARLVVIPTASASADQEPTDHWLDAWKSLKPASVQVLHTRDRTKADDAGFLEPLRKASGVWFEGGSQSRIADAYLGTAVERELYALAKRGGAIGGTSAGAAILSRVMIASGNPEAVVARGFDLVPDAVIDQHFIRRDRKARLFGVLDNHPGLVGYGIEEGTALLFRGRELRVVGDATVTVCLAKSTAREPREIVLKPGAVSDLTMLRRAARARAESSYPPKELPAPEVANGSLVIVGGGGMPDDVTKKFIELAGGPDALIVVLPTAGEGTPSDDPQRGEGRIFLRAGATNVKVLTAAKLKEVEDPKTLEVLQKARGVWFGGGRQWRFVDAYEGTKAEPLFREVLRRGGVIGGSSAGATIQGDYLCRGSPLGNLEVMCEGYERGFAFLPGVAIDQHFTQRKRFADMTALIKRYPQFLGIGIDETTALIVTGHVAEIMGRNKVQFYDGHKPSKEGEADYEVVRPGERYDLKLRRRVAP